MGDLETQLKGKLREKLKAKVNQVTIIGKEVLFENSI